METKLRGPRDSVKAEAIKMTSKESGLGVDRIRQIVRGHKVIDEILRMYRKNYKAIEKATTVNV